MTLAERSTHWSTVSKPKSNNPIGRGTGHDKHSDARERRSRTNRWLTIHLRRPVIGSVRRDPSAIREFLEESHAVEGNQT